MRGAHDLEPEERTPEHPNKMTDLDALKRYFQACHLYHKTYLLWKTSAKNIREYHLKISKADLEIGRAFLTVARKRQAEKGTYEPA